MVVPTGGFATVATSADVAAASGEGKYITPPNVPKVGTKPSLLAAPPTRTIGQRLDMRSVDLREWGEVDYTGAADMRGLVQTAFNDAMALGFEIVNRVPGTLTFGAKLVTQTGKPLMFRNEVRSQICAFQNGKFSTFQDRGNGCWLRFAHDDTGIEFNRSSGDATPAGNVAHRVFGNTLLGFGTMRDQGDPTVNGWAPRNTGFDIEVRNSGIKLDLVTLNSSRGINFYNADKSYCSFRGQPLIEGIRALYNYDVITLDDTEFWPYWSFHRNVKLFTAFTRIALRTARADGLYVKRLFDFQGNTTHLIENAPSIEASTSKEYLPGGTTYASHINYLYADATLTAVQVQSGCDGAHLTYDKVIAQPPDSGGLEADPEFRGRQSIPLLIQSDRVDVGIGHFRSAFAGASHASVTGVGSRLSIRDVTYGAWNRADRGSAPTNFPAFAAASGSVVEIEGMAPLFIGSGNPGNVDSMARKMPVLGPNAVLKTQDARTTAITGDLPDVAYVQTSHLTLGGSTNIQDFGRTSPGRKFDVLATSSLVLLHSDYLKCPGGSNITTRVGDTFRIVSDADGKWRITSYQRADVAVPA